MWSTLLYHDDYRSRLNFVFLLIVKIILDNHILFLILKGNYYFCPALGLIHGFGICGLRFIKMSRIARDTLSQSYQTFSFVKQTFLFYFIKLGHFVSIFLCHKAKIGKQKSSNFGRIDSSTVFRTISK